MAAVLGVVFLPILLQYEQHPKDPYYELAVSDQDSYVRVEIVTASFPQELGAFRVELRVDSAFHSFGPLPQGVDDLVSFFDANGDGVLNVGDYFLVEDIGTDYSLLILHPDPAEEGGVGFKRWSS